MLQRWNKPDSYLIKYHGSGMYLLPTGLQSSAPPLDTPDLHYISSLHDILTNPLLPSMGIKMFNEEWLCVQLPTDSPTCQPIPVSVKLEGPSPKWHDDLHSSATGIPVETFLPTEVGNAAESRRVQTSYSSSSTLPRKHFGRYGTSCEYRTRKMTRRKAGYMHNIYHRVYAKHSNDESGADPESRWRPECHECHECIIASNGVP
jgi:hypothetical protein